MIRILLTIISFDDAVWRIPSINQSLFPFCLQEILLSNEKVSEAKDMLKEELIRLNNHGNVFTKASLQQLQLLIWEQANKNFEVSIHRFNILQQNFMDFKKYGIKCRFRLGMDTLKNHCTQKINIYNICCSLKISVLRTDHDKRHSIQNTMGFPITTTLLNFTLFIFSGLRNIFSRLSQLSAIYRSLLEWHNCKFAF